MSDWKSLLSSSLFKQPDKVPNGWKTTIQISKELGKSESHTRVLIRQLKERKLVDTQSFQIMLGDQLRPVKHYKIYDK